MDQQHDLNEAPVVVVVVPLPAQGHLNQLLHFSRLVSKRQIPVHYVGSATHNRQAKHRVHGWDPSSISNIHFHDFPLPPFQTPPPDPHASNKFPAHLQPTFDATKNLREPLSKLLHLLSLTSKRVIVVHDAVMLFAAQEASSIPSVEAYCFNSISAFAVLFFRWELFEKTEVEGTEILNELPPLSMDGCFTDEFADFIARQLELFKFDAGDLYNTCHPIDGKFLELLSKETFSGDKKQWAIGPLNPVMFDCPGSSISSHMCLQWLDRQPPHSVIYVSFGTMTSISDEQITEIANGLEQSKQKFIWVLREADRGDIFAGAEQVRKSELPDNFEKRVEGVGMIVRDWAPQLEILAHKSTGGFLSHCGWNSCMESLSMGVPIAAWPMHSDQPRNTMLVTKVLKVGLVVKEWGSREEVVSSSVIESAVRKLMVSEEGKEMRKRAEELGGAVRQAVSEDGSSTAELDAFLAHICR